jgi:hypothetical protein
MCEKKIPSCGNITTEKTKSERSDVVRIFMTFENESMNQSTTQSIYSATCTKIINHIIDDNDNNNKLTI